MRKTRPPATPGNRQIENRLKLVLRGRPALTSACSPNWFSQEPLFLDTETTGLGNTAQVIEVALTDASGNAVFETRLSSSVPVEALAIHGVDAYALSGSPAWPDVATQLQRIIDRYPPIIFNSAFDLRILRQTTAAYHDPASGVSVHCVMQLSAKFFGATNRYGTISLDWAAQAASVKWSARAHAAVTDACMTAAMVNVIADYNWDLTMKLSSFAAS